MNETDTPETDAAECDCSEFYDIGVIPGQDSGPSGYVPIEAARKLERERDEARREAEASWDCKWPKPFWSWRTKADV